MRPLTDTETKTLFEKLANYTGASLKTLLTDAAPGPNPLLGRPVAAALQSILDYFEAEPGVPEDSRGRLVAETRRALAEVEQNGQFNSVFGEGIL